MARPLLAGLLLAAVTAAGCQGSKSPYTFAPVEGTVRKNGQPLPGVVVLFWGDNGTTQGPVSSGPTDSAGHYHLRTEQGVDGALVGRHRVCILETAALMQRSGGRNGRGKQLPKDLTEPGPSAVSPGYARREQTPLRAEVRPGEQVLDFDLK
jgi:hypothetical protein